MELDTRYNSSVSRKGTYLENRLSDTTTSSRRTSLWDKFSGIFGLKNAKIEKLKSRISLVVDSNDTIMGSKIITENIISSDQKRKYKEIIIEMELHYQTNLRSSFRKAMQLIHFNGETPNSDPQGAVEELYRISEKLVKGLRNDNLPKLPPTIILYRNFLENILEQIEYFKPHSKSPENLHHIRSYTRIYSIFRSNDYWKMSQDLKDTADAHYLQELEHNELLLQFREELRILQSYKVITKETCTFGIGTITKLLGLSNEKLQTIIYNPNTDGIMFRETDIIAVYEHFNQFINNAIFEVSNYKVISKPSWYYLDTKYKREQVTESIKRFEGYIKSCGERLIEFQHFLHRVRQLGGVDENQTKLALFTVNGIIRDFMIRNGYNLDIKIEPLKEP